MNRKGVFAISRRGLGLGLPLCLLLVALIPGAALAQDLSCGASISPTILTSPPRFVGDTLRIRLRVATGSIQGGTVMNIPNVKLALVCFNNGGFNTCTAGADSGDVSFNGNGTITDTCAGVAFTGAVAADVLTLTPNAAFSLAPNTSCNIEFDITVNAIGTDATPTLVQEAAAYDGMCDNGLPGSARGAIAFTVDECSVKVDKQVDCADGQGFIDATLVTNNEDGTLSCDGIDGEIVAVRYRAQNTGTVDLHSCTITESNPDIGSGPGNIGGILETTTTSFFNDSNQVCSDQLEAGEPDTATINCFCLASLDPNVKASATDSVDIDCLTPGLTVSKECVDTSVPPDFVADTVNVTTSNLGTTALENCVLTDSIDLNEPLNTCPGNGSPLQSQTLTPSLFNLPVGGNPVVSTGAINPALQAPACNTASVTCDIAGTGTPAQQITDSDTDPCEFEFCEVRLDKKITIDGVNFFDEEDFDPRIKETAIGWTGEDVEHVFVVENLGTSQVTCTLSDSRLGLIDANIVVDGMTSATIERTNQCNAALEGDDTATLNCVCEGTNNQRSDTDTASIDCQAPGLNITKNCVETADPNVFNFDIDVSNTGDATLVNCVVKDGVAAGQCPASPPPPAVTPTLFSAPFTLGPNSGLVDKSFPGQTVPATSCNVARVECNLSNGVGGTVTDPATGQPKVVGASAFETCAVARPGAKFIIIDEDGIDNQAEGGFYFLDPVIGVQNIFPGNPTEFTDVEVNDQIAVYGLRAILPFFQDHVGETVALTTGETGDEAWFAPGCVPAKWVSGNRNTCLTGAALQTGLNRFVRGIGNPPISPIPQSKLDKIPKVRPLRALGLVELIGMTLCAVIYDSDISINYDNNDTNGNLQGANYGIAAFTVLDVVELTGFSSSTLPEVQVLIEDAAQVCLGPFELFDAPIPRSSSVPGDIDPENPPPPAPNSNGYRNR